MLQEIDTGDSGYRVFFEENPCPMWILDAVSLQFIHVNRAATDYYGYSRDEFLSMTRTDIRAASDSSRPFNWVQSKGEDVVGDAGISSHRRKDGNVIYVQGYVRQIILNGSKVLLEMIVDQNEKVACEYRNRELGEIVSTQAKRLDYILSNIDDVVWATWADTQELIFSNAACEKAYGYTEAEMLADKSLFFNLILPEDKPAFFDSSNRLMTTGRADFEFRVRHKDGSIRHMRGIGTVMKGENGEPDITCGLNIDVTREKELLAQIEDSEQKLRALIDNTDDLVWSVSKEYTLIAANQAYMDFLRLFTGKVPQPGDCIFTNSFGIEAINTWKVYYTRALNGENFTVTETMMVDGKPGIAEVRFCPISNKNNQVIGISCFSRNITESESNISTIRAQQQQLNDMTVWNDEMTQQIALISELSKMLEENFKTTATARLRTAATRLERLAGISDGVE